jgi:hypothetical protein
MAGGGLMVNVLRQSLPEYTSVAVDNAIVGLIKMSAIALNTFSDSTRATKEENDGAFRVHGKPRHYLYLV